VLDDAETLGLRYVGVASPAGGTPQTHDAYRALAEEFNTFGAAARARGLKFYFHNHPGDFALDGGTPIYNTLVEESDRKLVYFELDIAWIEAGGQSAYEYLRHYGPWRFPLFHVKDLRYAADGPRSTPGNVNLPNRPFWLTDVGKGDIDFPKIFSALRDRDDHHYFVEHDDAPQDETADSSSPRPRNPAGSANTSWTSASTWPTWRSPGAAGSPRPGADSYDAGSPGATRHRRASCSKRPTRAVGPPAAERGRAPPNPYNSTSWPRTAPPGSCSVW